MEENRSTASFEPACVVEIDKESTEPVRVIR